MQLKGAVLENFVMNIGTIGDKLSSLKIQRKENEERQRGLFARPEPWPLPDTETCLHADDVQANSHLSDFVYLFPMRDDHCADQNPGHDFDTKSTFALVKEGLSPVLFLFKYQLCSLTTAIFQQ